jgi:regulation of enolase protein 1 (concanavalin A-like superfamily)
MRSRSALIFALLLVSFFMVRSGGHRGTKGNPSKAQPSLALAPEPLDVKEQTRPQIERKASTVSALPVKSQETDEALALSMFTSWSQRYVAAPAGERESLLEEGKQLAKERRPVFKELIQADPKAAIENAVPMVVRQKLPPELVSLLEERVNGVAALRLLQGVPLPSEPVPDKPLSFHEAEFKGGKTYRAYLYGKRAVNPASVPGASLNGVALDGQLAVNDAPSRTLEAGEVPTQTKPAISICPVSGLQTPGSDLAAGEPVSDATPAVETATQIVYFCDGAHIVNYNEALILGEGVSGGAFGFTGILPASPTPSLGVIKVLVIPMTYADQNAIPATEATLYSTLRDVADFYAKASYGKLTLVGTVTPPIKLPHNEAWYVNRDTSNGGDISGTSVEHLHAREEARKLGFDWNDYDSQVVRHNGGPGSYGGLATVPGSTVWVRTDGAGTWAHEIGHSFGLLHANFWDTAGTSAIGNGANAEYGHAYDIMGGGAFPAGHYNVQAKNQIKWLPDNFVNRVTQSGVYRIYPQDAGVLLPDRSYALAIVKDSQRTYWGELRSLFDTTPWIKSGMMLGWRFPNAGASNIQLIDTTPGSPFAKEDSPVSLGTTFSDFESGIHMTTVAANDSPRYIDVQVNIGQFAGNRPPTLALSASATSVPVGATVTFTATATDPDGDAIAYGWQHFGSTSTKIVSPNSPVITRTFTSAGTYVVSCTASDMKGGSTTRNVVITVGNGNSTYTISGRITAQGQGLQDVVVTANGANGVVTDADGYYTISNLTANTYTMTPLLYGYSFTELFNNSITVGPNASGANFTAVDSPVVTIAATVPNAYEAAPVTPGKFTITRSGDNSADLVVNVNAASGSATITTDYTFSPNYVSASLGFSTFTIPAGSSTLDVSVTPVVDTIAEGPETVILQLAAGTGYLVGTQSTATVVINDDDTALPKVSLAVVNASTIENSGVPATISVSRTGSTAASLTVPYTVGGTATNGTDYVTLSGSVIIPVGSASAIINVTPIDDSVSESLETVKLTIAAGATLIADPLALTATVNIVDDDVQTVTVVATDPIATEVDLTQPGAVADTGTFVITRAGDLTNPLTVYYAMSGTPSTGVQALHGVDYDPLPGVLVIPAGAAQGSVTIIPRYDTIGEGPESVVLSLGAGPTNYVLGSPSSATVTINDAVGTVPTVDVENTSSASEPSTNGNFRFTVRGGTGTGTLTINYTISGTATAGSDYSITGLNNTTLVGTTTVALNNGATVTKDLTVTPINDALLEDLESITLTITPSATYTSFAPTSSATMWMRDDDQPTVYVDTQVATGGSSTATEGTTSTPTKFYVARTGSTTGTLTVNFNLAGTATAGSDYAVTTGTAVTFDNATGNGSLTIAAGSPGGDIPIVITNDTTFEGKEQIDFTFAPGSYSRGLGTSMIIADNETSTTTVSFAAPSSSGSESVATVNIPVNLSAASLSPVTVDYAPGTNTTGTSSSVSTQALPYWVRVVRTGSSMTFFQSNDGAKWVQRGSAVTLSGLSSTTYYAGIAVGSSSATTSTTDTVDNFTISGLDSGATTGTAAGVNINGSTGSHTLTSGVYSITATGTGPVGSATTDQFRYIYTPISNSANCTVTARILTQTATSTSARVGVMLRNDVTNAGAIYAAAMVHGTGGFVAGSRSTLSVASATQTAVTTPVLSKWFKLQRSGDVFTTSYSNDGSAWTTIGTPQIIALGPTALAGLMCSARSDGSIATATFDNVSITPTPAGSLLGREVGFVNLDGSESLNAGTWTVNGSGAGVATGTDEGRFVATEVTGDFTLIARALTLSGGASNAQAGVMMRHTRDGYSRMMYAGWSNSSALEYFNRTQSASSASGSGVDYSLNPGTLTFAPGETTKNITLTVNNDTLREPNNLITLQLLNPSNAVLGSIPYHGYTIIDDETAGPTPYVGFAAATSTVGEGSGSALIQVSLSSPAAAAVTIDYATADGTALADSNYTSTSGTLSFAPGETVKSITIPIIDDTVIESAPLTLSVTLTNPSGCVLNANSTHTLSIADNDFPVVTIVASQPNATESGTAGQFTISRTGLTTSALTVSLSRSGTATSGTDFTALPTTVTIPIGATDAVVKVSPIQDTLVEGPETVILSVVANAAYTLGTPSSATVTIADDDRSTVSITATDPIASETPGNTGTLTVTRTAPTTAALTVNLTISGTATNGTDYTSIASTLSFAANQASKTITVTPIDDSISEGDETVVISIASGSYDIDASSFATVTIRDNDYPPTVFIDGPSSQGTLLASGNGIIVSATVADDGAPAPVTVQWSQVAGPGTATFESPTNAATAVTFDAPGNYVLRITATDTQFTVSDQVTVVVGSSLVASDWITQELGPVTTRRGQGLQYRSQFSVSGTGAGYASQTSDQANVMVRSVDGDGSIVARITSFANTGALSGLTIRDSMTRGANRAVLGFVPGNGLQFRARSTVSTTDTLVATQTGLTLPLWLKLSRNATTGAITASYAPDVSGSAGTFVQLGAATTIAMDNRSLMGLTTTNNSTAAVASAIFDNVTLTPSPVGPGLLSEDVGATPAAPGSESDAAGVYTISASTSGYYHGWQYYGDLVVTTRLTSMSSGAGSAIAGLRIAESIETGAYAHFGRIPTSAYNGFFWTSVAGGSGGGVPSGVSVGDWIRMVRSGNSITAYRAPNVSGNPGTWVQVGQPQTIIMTTPVWVGFYVNNSTGVGMNTVSFSNLSIVPLNKAPVVSIGSVPALTPPPVTVTGVVTDDNYPAPPSLTTQWLKLSGPGTVAFGNASLPATTATLTIGGNYALRLRADDSSAVSFKDVAFSAYTTPYELWQAQQFSSTGGISDPNAALLLDPDNDGQSNLMEYALGSNPNAAGSAPISTDSETVATASYLRLSVSKNPNATDVQYVVEATSTLAIPSSWSSVGLIIETDTASQLVVRDNVAISPDTQRFMRLRVTKP